MAIEDGYQLALTLDKTVKATPDGQPVDIESALKAYQGVSTFPFTLPARHIVRDEHHLCYSAAATPSLSSSSLTFALQNEVRWQYLECCCCT